MAANGNFSALGAGWFLLNQSRRARVPTPSGQARVVRCHGPGGLVTGSPRSIYVTYHVNDKRKT
jgi:hypothetical protein